MKKARLALATEKESEEYYKAASHSGLTPHHKDIDYLMNDPLLMQERKKQPRRTDDSYPSVADTTPRTIQWYARHSDGWRRPFGSVMIVTNDPKEK